jgi:hypothetical protein
MASLSSGSSSSSSSSSKKPRAIDTTAPGPVVDRPLLRLPGKLFEPLLACLPQRNVRPLRLVCKAVENAVLPHIHKLKEYGGKGYNRDAFLSLLQRTKKLQELRIPSDFSKEKELQSLILQAFGDGSVGSQLRSLDAQNFRG